MKKHILENGTTRIKSVDFELYEIKNGIWIKSSKKILKSTKEIIKDYIKTNSEQELYDNFSKDFLKGFVDSSGLIYGERIQTLPNGKKLSRGGFSLFAKNLKYNFDGDPEWDICYENSSGSKTYLYCEDKIHLEKKRKAKLVDEFTKYYSIILENLEIDIKATSDSKYLALYTLIITHIRVGNLEHYKHLGHMGLTTLKKDNIKVSGNTVIFDYIGKDAIPHHKEFEFPDFYIKKLNKILKSKNKDDFVFSNKNNNPIHSLEFSDILFKYTQKHFYPHIIRSYYADLTVLTYLRKHRKTSKKEVISELKEIAWNLGHKKFNKSKNEWEPSYKITVDNYIRPEYYERLCKLYEKK